MKGLQQEVEPIEGETIISQILKFAFSLILPSLNFCCLHRHIEEGQQEGVVSKKMFKKSVDCVAMIFV